MATTCELRTPSVTLCGPQHFKKHERVPECPRKRFWGVVWYLHRAQTVESWLISLSGFHSVEAIGRPQQVDSETETFCLGLHGRFKVFSLTQSTVRKTCARSRASRAKQTTSQEKYAKMQHYWRVLVVFVTKLDECCLNPLTAEGSLSLAFSILTTTERLLGNWYGEHFIFHLVNTVGSAMINETVMSNVFLLVPRATSVV